MIRNIAVVSLSRGVLGEAFAQHEVEIGLQRLAGYGINVRFMPNARRGIDYLTAHPEARAADLLQAFRDPEIDLILCAIGGDDTYRLLPYLFDHDELRRAVTDKIFLGFSDTTVNHMMLHKVGLPTFYGQAFLPDVCELSRALFCGAAAHRHDPRGHAQRCLVREPHGFQPFTNRHCPRRAPR